ncbi:hypothetical protein [Pyrococcus sp. ST04]|uniref:hypothetical protein n=1 Tax=Pyrococcus sp. ST04 TaxID=1183377 RepID=UPI0002605902|nr:hypothetical protein [Pyrococcus sp. ST04]AFK21683.1 hypothetical protein Py04_0077 [Pyrococcus sp. ST04]
MVGLDVILRDAEKVSEEEAWRRLELLYKTRKIKWIYKDANNLKYRTSAYYAPNLDKWMISLIEKALNRGVRYRALPDMLTAAVFEYYRRNPEYKKTVDYILDKIHPEARETILKIWDGLGEKVYNLFSEFFGRDLSELDAFKDYADYIMNESLKYIEMHFKEGKEKMDEVSYKLATDTVRRDPDPIHHGFGLNLVYKCGGSYGNITNVKALDLESMFSQAGYKIEEFGKWIAEVSKVYMAKVDEELARNGFTF